MFNAETERRWALTQAECSDDDEKFCRENGDFEAAVFFQSLARALRNEQISYHHFMTSIARTDLLGGATHLRNK